MRTSIIAVSVLMAGCGWNHLPNQHEIQLDEALWDAAATLPTEDGLYVRLSHVDGLALVNPDGSSAPVDLGPGSLTAVSASPNLKSLLAFVTRTRCEDDNVKSSDLHECPSDERDNYTDLLIIEGGEAKLQIELDSPYNSVRWSPDGNHAIAILDARAEGAEADGVVSLSTVLAIDVVNGVAVPTPVGFAATEVLFDDASTRAVVLSQNEVAVIDLATSPPAASVTFALTLDPDQVVNPVGIELTPDGDKALISVQGDDSLYILDLINPSVNIKALSGQPTAMAVLEGSDRTVLVYESAALADVVEHERFDVESLVLDEPMTDIIEATNFNLLYATNNQLDVYRLDIETIDDAVTYDLIEYRLQAAAQSMHLAPSEDFAIALTNAGYLGGSFGMEILDLRPDSDETYPYALEGRGVGLAFSETEDTVHALLLQQDVDYLFQMDLYTGDAEQIDLSAPPVAIGSMPSGEFYITHDIGTGLVTFLDPATGNTTEAAGFATYGLMTVAQTVDTEEE